MNPRSQAILSALNYVSSVYSDAPLNVVEVGCMFKDDEGLSTHVIADFLATRPEGGHLISIEYNVSHIEAAKEMIRARASFLERYVEYRHGHSLSVLPEISADLRTVHFFSLDGGAHPEVCLEEFEYALAHLAPDGVIMVDDAQQIPPSPAYGLPRPFGKATLILPMLILASNLQMRDKVSKANSVPGDPKSVPNSHFLNQLLEIDIPNVSFSNYAVIGGRHQILFYGNPTFIAQITTPTDPGLRPSSNTETRSLGRVIKLIRAFLPSRV
jgi:hypothetical protein